MTKKIRVGLLFGGKSGEHDVSLQTAQAVINALDHSKYEVQPFYITKEGQWKPGPALNGPIEDIKLLTGSEGATEAAAKDTDLASNPGIASLFSQSANAGKELTASNKDSGRSSAALDVVFPLLHGTFGEDGTVQGLLEMANLPYVGGGVLASAVGMDKVMMKKLFAQAGLPQCVFRYFKKSQWQKDQAYFLMEIEVAVGYPCFVKPANLGSSVGVSKANNREELLQAVDEAFRYDLKVIVEEFVNGREIEISVLGNDEPEASVPGEVVSSNDFYDYKAKYIDGNSAMIIPAEVPEETANQLQELAISAFQAIEGSGLARVDFFVGKEDGKILLNEINTMPGFTPFSMYPLLWKESGKPYKELLDDLITLAFERHRERNSLQYTFEI